MELFEAAKTDRVECLDTQSKPPHALSLSLVYFKPEVGSRLLVPVCF